MNHCYGEEGRTLVKSELSKQEGVDFMNGEIYMLSSVARITILTIYTTTFLL